MMQKKAKIIYIVQEEIKRRQKSLDRLFQKEQNRTTTVIALVDSIKTGGYFGCRLTSLPVSNIMRRGI